MTASGPHLPAIFCANTSARLLGCADGGELPTADVAYDPLRRRVDQRMIPWASIT
jgi:hypothetical protein